MPKRKITLEEAFAVIEQHGLKARIVAVEDNQEPSAALADFLEPVATAPQQAIPQGKKEVKITLYAAHTVSSGGSVVVNSSGDKSVSGSSIETYGPGVITVPIAIAQQLLHQDALAREADERFLDRKFRSFVVVPKDGMNVRVPVSEESNFDLSGLLGALGNSGRSYRL